MADQSTSEIVQRLLARLNSMEHGIYLPVDHIFDSQRDQDAMKELFMLRGASQQMEWEGIMTRCGGNRREIAVSKLFDAENEGMISRWTAKLEGARRQRMNGTRPGICDDKALSMHTSDAGLATLTMETQKALAQMKSVSFFLPPPG